MKYNRFESLLARLERMGFSVVDCWRHANVAILKRDCEFCYVVDNTMSYGYPSRALLEKKGVCL